MVDGFTVLVNGLALFIAGVILRNVHAHSRMTYPADRERLQEWLLEGLAVVTGVYAVMRLPDFWALKLLVVGMAATYLAVIGRYLLISHLSRRMKFKPLPAWQAFTAAMHYLKRGRVEVTIFPFHDWFNNEEHYMVHIRGANGRYLLRAQLTRLGAFRLLQSLAAHYPAKDRPQPGWATCELLIDVRDPASPAKVQHDLAPVSVIVGQPA